MKKLPIVLLFIALLIAAAVCVALGFVYARYVLEVVAALLYSFFLVTSLFRINPDNIGGSLCLGFVSGLVPILFLFKTASTLVAVICSKQDIPMLVIGATIGGLVNCLQSQPYNAAVSEEKENAKNAAHA